MVVEGVRLIDCTFRGVTSKNLIQDAAAPEFRRVVINPAETVEK